jgi:hypothetical protein
MFIDQAINQLKTLILQSPYTFIQNQENDGGSNGGFKSFDERLTYMAAICLKDKIPQDFAEIKAACEPAPSYMPSTAVEFAMNAKDFAALKQQVATQYAVPTEKVKL